MMYVDACAKILKVMAKGKTYTAAEIAERADCGLNSMQVAGQLRSLRRLGFVERVGKIRANKTLWKRC